MDKHTFVTIILCICKKIETKENIYRTAYGMGYQWQVGYMPIDKSDRMGDSHVWFRSGAYFPVAHKRDYSVSGERH